MVEQNSRSQEGQINTEYGMKSKPEIVARLRELKAMDVFDEEGNFPEGSRAVDAGRQEVFAEYNSLVKYLNPDEVKAL